MLDDFFNFSLIKKFKEKNCQVCHEIKTFSNSRLACLKFYNKNNIDIVTHELSFLVKFSAITSMLAAR